MKLDILAIGAHPDDIELSCAGTLIAHADQGKVVGVLDLTRGEMGTRGTPEQRLEEAAAAASVMNLSARENLELKDSHFLNDNETQLKVIRMLRKYQPEIVLANATYDRHPDHGRGAALVEEAVFKSGLRKIETELDGNSQEAWRPKKLYHYIQSVHQEPDFLVDISEAMERKMESIRSYRTQFFDPNSTEPNTYISSPDFMQMIESRAREFGHRIGVKYAEGFTHRQFMGVDNLWNLL